MGTLVAAIVGGLVALLVVRLTNKHQSRLAAIAREKAAIADVIAGADMLLTEYSWGVKGIDAAANALGAAAARWCMELSDPKMAGEILLWSPYLGRLAFGAHEAEQAIITHTTEFDALLKSVNVLRFSVLGWPSADKEEQKRLVQQLESARSEFGGNPDLTSKPPAKQPQS